MRWILILPLLILLVLFGLSNQQAATFQLWPTDLTWTGPLYVGVLVIGAAFFLLGALIAWFASFPHRSRAHRMQEAAQVMEAELAEHRAAAAKRVGPVPPRGAGTSLVAAPRPAA
ncbi:LapA family protein [Paracraurococcus lichenis]|uniref:LapA family protein n=1 Tax=Paracraurococcus lichenis TaxID=3064888 RepID=A0ABT9DYA0_9PROT|nr:LapA family protein [Paracraurococcus sp. LOR1-02]MDO9708890.1 LapA family protein [Paracraurococcus sp. LOR1-02]